MELSSEAKSGGKEIGVERRHLEIMRTRRIRMQDHPKTLTIKCNKVPAKILAKYKKETYNREKQNESSSALGGPRGKKMI